MEGHGNKFDAKSEVVYNKNMKNKMTTIGEGARGLSVNISNGWGEPESLSPHLPSVCLFTVGAHA